MISIRCYQINRTQGQVLLMNVEQFSFQMANTLNVSQANNRTIAAENIGKTYTKALVICCNYLTSNICRSS